jgi:hypothetical protein
VNAIPAWIQAVLVAALVVLIHLSLVPKVADLDSFYHLGHAAAYLEGSLFDTSLPWATRSVIADKGADLWWGFHVVLTPFAALADPARAINVAGIVMTLALSGALWYLLRRHGVASPGPWVALLLVAVPNILYRYLMVRPHVLSLGLGLLLLSFLVKGRWWQAGMAAAAITWLHLGLFWMPAGLLAAYALSRTLVPCDTGIPLRRAALAVAGGMTLGWLLRPHPFASLELAWIQIGELFALKGADTPLGFAGELAPLPVDELVITSWSFLAVWLLCAGLAIRLWLRDRLADLPPGERGLLVTSLLVSGVFFVLTLASARRAQVEWVAFGALALPLLWAAATKGPARKWVVGAGLVMLAVHLPWAVHRHRLNVELTAFPANTLVEAADWLAANTPPGDVVFHARWDNFGPLLAHNRSNRYLSGMDPVFQYSHDARLYWEFFWLSANIHDRWTCDAFPCHEGTATDTHEVVRHHFGARWVLVQPLRNPKLTLFLLEDPRFEMVLETQHEAVFQVLDGAAPGEVRPGGGRPGDLEPGEASPGEASAGEASPGEVGSGEAGGARIGPGEASTAAVDP